jgi:membrane protease YdiL (CAAX protease family)
MYTKNEIHQLLMPQFKVYPFTIIIATGSAALLLNIFTFVFGLKTIVPDNIVLYILGGILLIPFIEELLFRHLLQKVLLHNIVSDRLKFNIFLKSKNWKYLIIVFVALLFSLIHFKLSLQLITLTFLNGLIYGIAYYKTDSLLTPWIAHASVNFFALGGF